MSGRRGKEEECGLGQTGSIIKEPTVAASERETERREREERERERERERE